MWIYIAPLRYKICDALTIRNATTDVVHIRYEPIGCHYPAETAVIWYISMICNMPMIGTLR